MGATELMAAFNAVAVPKYRCMRAMLGYKRKDGVEATILTFVGKRQDGTAFEEISAPLAAGVDVNMAARSVAQALLDRGQSLS